MISRPQVTVMMAVHNGGIYLPPAVASIQRQTFDNLELIVTDDASTDGSAAFLEDAARADARIRVVRHQRRAGQSAALNTALQSARGEWVCILDADDIALPDRIEKQLAFAKAHPGLKACGALTYYIEAAGRRVGKSASELSKPEDYARFMRQGEAIGLCHSTAFIHRLTMLSLGGYRSAFDPANDCDLWNRIAEVGMVLVQQEYLVEYRVHPASLTATRFGQMRLKYEWLRACMAARRSGKSEPVWDEFIRGWQAAPWRTRMNRWRKMHAKRLYRQAAVHYAYGDVAQAGIRFSGSVFLQPGYALSHLSEQLL